MSMFYEKNSKDPSNPGLNPGGHAITETSFVIAFVDHELDKEHLDPSKYVEKGKLQTFKNINPRKPLKEAKY